MSALLQRLDHFARHVSLVMLGKDGRGLEHSVRFQLSFGDDTLPFAEQIGEDPVIEDGDVGLAVGDAKSDAAAGAALDAAILHQAPDPHPPVRRNCAESSDRSG